jgi:hypothetical protein
MMKQMTRNDIQTLVFDFDYGICVSFEVLFFSINYTVSHSLGTFESLRPKKWSFRELKGQYA